MPESPYAPVFELIRGEIVESIHYGSIAVVDSHGRLNAYFGDPFTITYLRSSAKPLQVVPFLEEGGQAAFHLTAQEIALMCASHSGTDEHIGVLEHLQAKTGVSEEDLLCGIHPLSHKPTAKAMQERGEPLTQNRHNCSGKHTSMLAYAHMLGVPLEGYTDPEHPVQRKILSAFAELCDLPLDQVHIGIDGCSAPNFATPLYNAALAIARLCDPENAAPSMNPQRIAACHSITQAMLNYPNMVGGPNSFDTLLMSAADGRVLAKGGAEGYQILGLFEGVLRPGFPGIGIAYKISDGDLKARSLSSGDSRGHVRPAVALEILRQLRSLPDEAVESLADYGPEFPLYNWQKLLVGQGRPCFQLKSEESMIGRSCKETRN